MASGEPDEAFTIGGHEGSGTDVQRACPALDEGCEGRLDVAIAADIENGQLPPDCLRRRLHVSSLGLGFGSVWTDEHGKCGFLRDELVQQLKSFRP
jgi:hypothetical protein